MRQVETLLIAMFPFLMSAAKVASWVVIIAGITSTIWIIIQIVWRIKNWNKDK